MDAIDLPRESKREVFSCRWQDMSLHRHRCLRLHVRVISMLEWVCVHWEHHLKHPSRNDHPSRRYIRDVRLPARLFPSDPMELEVHSVYRETVRNGPNTCRVRDVSSCQTGHVYVVLLVVCLMLWLDSDLRVYLCVGLVGVLKFCVVIFSNSSTTYK